MDEISFQMAIRKSLAEHPNWLPSALAAVSAGMADAIAAEQQRASSYDLAFRSALGLLSPERLSAETKAMLNSAIVRAIPDEGASMIETETKQRLSA